MPWTQQLTLPRGWKGSRHVRQGEHANDGRVDGERLTGPDPGEPQTAVLAEFPWNPTIEGALAIKEHTDVKRLSEGVGKVERTEGLGEDARYMNHSTSSPALEFRSVTVRYDVGPAILRDVSFVVNAGERVALLGLNGSGKTTLLAAVVGLVPHDGEIFIDGTLLERRSLAAVRDRVGYVFNVPEEQLLLPRVLDDVAFGLSRRGVSATAANARAQQVLEALGVVHLAESPVHHLSHGQKQRVALAGSLVTEPRLLLLDEPSAGLDPLGKRVLVDLLARQDASMMVATHDVRFAEDLCTRFLMLDEGRVVLDGPDASFVRRRWQLD